MNTKTLTIVIEGIPEEALSDLWKDSIQAAKDEMGFIPEQTDAIKLNFNLLIERYPEVVPDMLAELLTSAIAAYSAQYFEDTYNKQS
jgi:hypothetical protein